MVHAGDQHVARDAFALPPAEILHDALAGLPPGQELLVVAHVVADGHRALTDGGSDAPEPALVRHRQALSLEKVRVVQPAAAVFGEIRRTPSPDDGQRQVFARGAAADVHVRQNAPVVLLVVPAATDDGVLDGVELDVQGDFLVA